MDIIQRTVFIALFSNTPSWSLSKGSPHSSVPEYLLFIIYNQCHVTIWRMTKIRVGWMLRRWLLAVPWNCLHIHYDAFVAYFQNYKNKTNILLTKNLKIERLLLRLKNTLWHVVFLNRIAQYLTFCVCFKNSWRLTLIWLLFPAILRGYAARGLPSQAASCDLIVIVVATDRKVRFAIY